MNKKMLSFFTAILALTVFITGCSSSKADPEKEKVKLVIATPPLLYGKLGGEDAQSAVYTDFLEYAAEKFAAQYTDAEVEFEVHGFDFVDENEAIKEKLGTENAPDVLFEGFFNMSNYIHTGYMVPLDDTIDDTIRNDISDRILSEGMYQGKLYMVPFYHLPNTMVYNADLFHEAGLDSYIAEKGTITNWSLDDWETILDTLAATLPINKFPMMMYALNNQGDTHIMTLLRAFGNTFFGEDGLINVNTPEGIKALKWIQDGVQRNWYAPASENLQISDMMELFRNGQLAISMMNPSNQIFFDESGIDARQVNFPSVSGNGISTTFVTGFGVFDNKDDKKLKIAKEFVKFVCNDEELQQACMPNIPVRISLQELYKDEILMKDAYSANESTLVNFTNNLPNWSGVRAVFYQQMQNLLTGEKTPEQVAADIDEACNEAVKQGLEEAK